MSLITLDAWRRLWTELGARDISGGLLNQLLSAYSQPHRHYHTLQHLRECLAMAEAASAVASRPAEVELALWFHDAVYEPMRHDNEVRSADWAHASVLAAGSPPETADRVAALVLATRHDAEPAPADPDTDLLLDVDLSILGTAAERFDAYERAVRAEYAHVAPPAWRQGRQRVLAGFLARPRIFRTAVFHDALEAPARANLRRTLDRLAGPV